MDMVERRKRALGPPYWLFYEKPAHLVRGDGLFLSVDLVKEGALKTPDTATARQMVFSNENADHLLTALDGCFARL